MSASLVSTTARRYSDPYDIDFDWVWGADVQVTEQ
jgi:hypothetical protein